MSPITSAARPSWAQPTIQSVNELVQSVHAGDLALPDFQRDVVWDPADVQALLVSVLAQYPVGTLLFLEAGGKRFKKRPLDVEGASDKLSATATLVLDGQQRLTALYEALSGQGDAIYYVDLEILGAALSRTTGVDAESLEKVIHHRVARGKGKKAPIINLSDQADQRLLPLEVLGSSTSNQWALAAASHLFGQSDPEATLELLNLVTHVTDAVTNYALPVVTLPASTTDDAVCKIFETMNLRGVRLGVFELLTARFWPAGVDLRTRWDAAKTEHPILGPDEFDIDPYYLLQAVSLRATRGRVKVNQQPTASAQRSAVLNLSAADFSTYWDETVLGAASSLQLLKAECGVLSSKLLPYSMILVPMSAIWHMIAEQKGAKRGALIEKLIRYFWCTVFMRNYDQGGNSQAGRDFIDLERWFGGGAEPEAVAEFVFARDTLDQARTNLKALYRGVMALTVRHGARDFHVWKGITADSMAAESIDSHHVFPQQWLKTHASGVDAGLSADLILNRALIDRTTNQSIGGKNPPSVYLELVKEELGGPRLNQVLKSQLLPTGKHAGLWTDEYQKYILARRKLVADAIAVVTGDGTGPVTSK